MGKKFLAIVFVLSMLFVPLAVSLADDSATVTTTTETTSLISVVNDAAEATGSVLSKLPFTYGAMVLFECGKTVELNDYVIKTWTIESKPILNIGISAAYATTNVLAPGVCYKANTALTYVWSWIKDKTGLSSSTVDNVLSSSPIYVGPKAAWRMDEDEWDWGLFITTKF